MKRIFRFIATARNRPTIIVPGSVSAIGASGPVKEDSTCTRTPSFMARPTERVCSTLAPTEASSSISS